MLSSIATPPHLGSYEPDDVTFLLTELQVDIELPANIREKLIRNGAHYAESLPVEQKPSSAYSALFEDLLAQHAARIARRTRVLSRRILGEVHPEPVLVSLARAGTPVGILVRRALALEGVNAPHLTISIVRGRGLDPRAVRYLDERFDPARVVFIDGWTGKGAIRDELAQGLASTDTAIAPRLAVLTDPAHVTELCASREDELIPSACLNSTVSGLISRTVIRPDLLGPDTFHGVRVYRQFAHEDYSNRYLDAVSRHFHSVSDLDGTAEAPPSGSADGRGAREVALVQAEYGVESTHRIKPGIGETTRVLLRRVPRAVVIDPRMRDRLEHVLMLATERGVPVYKRHNEIYACFGLIDEHTT